MHLILLAALALAAVPAAAIEYPTLEHPVGRALLARYQADQVLLARADLMSAPAAPSWPCEVSEVDQYKLAGLSMAHPQLRAEADKASRKMMRELGLGSEGTALMEYSEIRITPLQAQCESGKLHGEVQLLASYVMKSGGESVTLVGGTPVASKSITTMRSQTRRHVQVQHGEILPESMTITESSSSNETSYSSPDIAERVRAQNAKLGLDKPMVIKNVVYVGADEVTAVFMLMNEPKVSGSMLGVDTTWVPVLSTMLSVPMDASRRRNLTYSGRQLVAISHLKGGKMHGPQLTFMENFLKNTGKRLDQMPGWDDAREVVIDGVSMIEKRSCMQNGVPVKTVECPNE